MKTTKKNMILVAISVGIIVCVGIIMAIVAQNKASATESTCTTCGGTNIEYISIGDGKHKYECQDCLTILSEEDCTWGVFSTNDNNTLHTRKCEKCQGEDSHAADFSGSYFAYGDGTFHSKKCNGDADCLEILMHQPDWSNNDGICAYDGNDGTCGIHCTHDGETTGTCTICGEVLSEEGQTCEHTLGWSSDNGDGTHTGTCTKCGKEVTENHIIDESKYERTETTHAKKKQCLKCAYMVTETAEAHTGGTHSNGGKCTVCDYQYQNHSQGTTVAGYDKTATTHTAKYICTESGCTENYTGTAEAHTGGTHSNGGKCTVCDYQYQTHGKSGEVKEYIITMIGHTPIYKCTEQGCTENYTGLEEAHKVTTSLPNFDGTHTGTCTVCQKKITENCSFYSEFIDITVTKHTEVVRCSGCNLEQIKNPEAHNFIDGTCVCGARQTDECTNHYITTGTDNGDGTHTGTCPNCEKQITEEHNFENGACTKCRAAQNEQTCTNHQITTGTDNGNGTHTGTCPNCNKQITESHNYVNGTCTKCGATQGGSETCEHDFEIKHNDTMHWEQCKKCNEVKNNKKHTFVNGKCSVCEYECKHTNTTAKKDNTYHWTECNDCGKELNKEKHSYTNGKCSCGKTEETEDCTHKNKEWKYNKTNHWQECKDCGATIEGTKSAHNFVNGKCSVCTYECQHTNTTVKKDNTYHWTECNDCGKELNKEQHSYINGKCNCGEVEKTEECKHINREWKSNETEHWQVCKDCGQEIEGTRAKHVNVDGKCKNCGLQEDSKSGTKLPNTGNKTMIITLPLVLALVAFGAIKMKKYKDV